MLAIWREAVDQFEQGNDFVLATILEVKGSSPRHTGTRFLVRKDRVIVGTIGGGLFEADVQNFATSALEKGVSQRVFFSFKGKDAHSDEMICGGDAEVLVEYVRVNDKTREKIFRRLLHITRERRSAYLFTDLAIPLNGQGSVNHLLVEDQGTRTGGFPGDDLAVGIMPEPRLLKPSQVLEIPGSDHPVFLEWIRPAGTAYIFGAGHVGECVAHLAAYVNFRVVILDDRSDFASPERIPDADQVVVLDSFRTAFQNLNTDEDSYLVVVTRGHAHDKTVLEQALRTNVAYIGMIGSRRKSRLILEALLQEGFSREDLQRVHAPIGLPIGGETPQEIAVSIVAEMVQIRNQKDRLKGLGG